MSGSRSHRAAIPCLTTRPRSSSLDRRLLRKRFNESSQPLLRLFGKVLVLPPADEAAATAERLALVGLRWTALAQTIGTESVGLQLVQASAQLAELASQSRPVIAGQPCTGRAGKKLVYPLFRPGEARLGRFELRERPEGGRQIVRDRQAQGIASRRRGTGFGDGFLKRRGLPTADPLQRLSLLLGKLMPGNP